MKSLIALALERRPSIAQIWSWLKAMPGGGRVFFKLIGQIAPYTGTIDGEVRSLETGRAEVVLFDQRGSRNHLNSLHAIALMNLGEVVTGLTMLYVVDGVGRGIITTLKMDYMKKARGPITATCEANIPTRQGRHDVTLEALLRDESGDVVAKATAIWRVTIGK